MRKKLLDAGRIGKRSQLIEPVANTLANGVCTREKNLYSACIATLLLVRV